MGPPFRLEAITLRGIGPYYDAARLELRPITVLCGKNGSGKSTWFKALDLLRRSSAIDEFPFAWDVSDSRCEDINTINARLYLNDDPGTSGAAENAMPPGTIGLEILAVDDFPCHLPFARNAEGNAAESMLSSGVIRRGTKISIQFSHPQIASDDEPTQFHDAVRLIVDGGHQLWFHRPLRQSGEYRFECTGSFSRGGSISDLTLSPVSSFDPRPNAAEPSEFDWNGKACRNAVQLIREVTIAATAGVFHLGAIRPIQQIQYVNTTSLPVDGESEEGRARRAEDERLALETRNVGENGSCALPLFRSFAYNRMVRTFTPGDASSHRATSTLDGEDSLGYVFEGFVSQWMDKLLAVRIGQSTEARGPESRRLDAIHDDAGPQPLGYMEHIEGHPVDRDVSFEPGALAIFEHRSFGWEKQPPGRFSAGFHQLFPIIAQVGLMQRHEAFFLENPEVHLPPHFKSN